MANRDEKGRFIKGHSRICNENTSNNISNGVKNHLPSTAFKKGMVAHNKFPIPKIPSLCKCGCNNVVWGSREYISGHNSRGQRLTESTKNKLRIAHQKPCIKIPVLCACGCNEVVWGGNQYIKGHHRPWTGKNHKSETIFKLSKAKIGSIPWNKGKIGIYSEETIKKNSEAHKGKQLGEEHPCWAGGTKVSRARKHAKEKEKGFVLLVKNNPYNEPIAYHHIQKKFPYVVHCPVRIHKMFMGKNHIQNVNAMLGIKIEL